MGGKYTDDGEWTIQEKCIGQGNDGWRMRLSEVRSKKCVDNLGEVGI